ncbi:MAG: hypothetical protein ACI9S9_004057 [Planctomycetota bacterium]|jgi:hypothetical protein
MSNDERPSPGDSQTPGDSQWHELDDTVADGPSPAEVPDEARKWIAEQRTMHGLLRALNTADSTAREARVESVLTSIDAHDARAHRRHWVAVAAAALLMATLGIWFASPPSLPTAEAAMARIADQLTLNVDRKYHVKLSTANRKRPERVFHEFNLTVRPGMRFLIEGRFAFAGLRISPGRSGAPGRIGCDGETVWIEPGSRRHRRSGPLADRERLLEGLGDILDTGYLDLHSLVAKLPGNFDLRVVDRSQDEQGRQLLHIKAHRRARSGSFRVRSAELTVDELTGIITHLDAQVRLTAGGMRHVLVDYLGQPDAGEVDYSRPW